MHVPIRIIQEKKLCCSLPREIAVKDESCVVKLTFDDKKLFVAWNGHYTDSLEVGYEFLATNDIIKDMENAPDVVKVELVSGIDSAAEVSLVPATSLDWDMIQSASEHIQERLIHSLPLVQVGTSIIIPISDHIRAVCNVEAVLTSGGRTLLIDEAARLNENSFLLIKPNERQQGEGHDHIDDVLDVARELANVVMPAISLRVLPDEYRDFATSLDISPSSKGRRLRQQPGKNVLFDPFDSFLDAEEAMSTSSSRHDALTCLLHPCVIEAAFARLKNQKGKGEKERENGRDWMRQLKWDDDGYLMAFISPYLRDSELATRSATRVRQMALRLQLCTDVAAYHVWVPEYVRDTLELHDYSSISLRLILPSHHNAPSMPQTVQARCVKWASGDGIGEGSASTEDAPKPPPVSTDALRSGLLNLLEVATPGLLPISCGCIVPVQLSATQPSCHFLLHMDACGEVDKSGKLRCHCGDEPTVVMLGLGSDVKEARVSQFMKNLRWVDTSSATLSTSREAQPSRSASTSEALSPRQTSLLGVDAALHSLVQDMALSLCRPAIAQRLAVGVVPATGALLTGKPRSGRTRLARSAAAIMAHSTQCTTHVEMLSLQPLVRAAKSSRKGLGLSCSAIEDILDRVTVVLRRARARAPSLVVLDDLDELCPARPESVPGQPQPFNQWTSVAVDVITPLLTHLLDEVRRCNENASRRAEAMITPRGTVDARLFMPDRATAVAMHGTVYVLATAKGPVDARLLSLGRLRRVFNMPSLDATARLNLLSAALKDKGVAIENDMASTSQSALSAATEGFGPADLMHISQQVASTVIRSGATKAYFADILAVAQAFISPELSQNLRGSASSSSIKPLRWKDVVGLKDAKDVIIKTFQLPVIFRSLFARSPVGTPKGLLLYGPPGNGKTVLAQAAAVECGLLLIHIRGPELLSKYIGSSEAAIRDLFERACTSGRPSLIFFDEFEALAPRRGADSTGVTDRVVNQLLTFLDGVESNLQQGAAPVFVMAATTRPDLIDPALLRPGRIEKHVYVGMPDAAAREDLLLMALSRVVGGGREVDSEVEVVGGGREVDSEVEEDEAERWRASAATVARDPAAEHLSAADLVGLVSTAHLMWVHEEIKTSSQREGHRQTRSGIRGRHLVAALQQTKPSLSTRDRDELERVYDQYRGGPRAENPTQYGEKVALH